MSGALTGQVALVTGCARIKGVGRGIALALATEGCDLVVTDVSPGGTRNLAERGEAEEVAHWRGLDSLVAEVEGLGRRCLAVTGDVGRKADADQMVASAIAHFGKLDILVNNAAAPHGADRNLTWEVPEEAWDEVMRVNAKGAFLMSSAAARHLVERGAPGRIINISSGGGKWGRSQRAAYSSSKAAMLALTQSMAEELASTGVTVNAVCPGGVDTARSDSRTGRVAAGLATAEQVIGSLPPVGRIGTAADVAHAVVFLAHPSAGFVTGAAIDVNGGQMMT